MEIFCSPNTVSDSVENSESHDIKFITWFPGNPILKILIKICNCVGYTNMRRRFLVKVSLIALFNCPVILTLFSVGLFDFEWTYAISTHVKSHFWSVFSCKTIFPLWPTGRDWYQKTWNFFAYLLIWVKSLSRPVHLRKRPRESLEMNFRVEIPRESIQIKNIFEWFRKL